MRATKSVETAPCRTTGCWNTEAMRRAFGTPVEVVPRRGVPGRRFAPSMGRACVVLVLFFCLAGCDHRQGGRRYRGNASIRIVIVGQGRDEPTWPVLQTVAAQFAERLANVSLEAIAPATRSPQRQRELLLTLQDRDVDAICVEPSAPSAMRGEIDGFARRGTPVVTFGRDVRDSRRAAYSGPAAVELGEAAAKACSAVLTPESKSVLLLSCRTDPEEYGLRSRAFKQALPRAGRGDLLRELVCDGNPLDAARMIRRQAKMYPRMACWVLLDDWPLQNLSPDERLVPSPSGLVVCNGSPAHFKRLRNGTVFALIGFDYRKVVEEALYAAVQAVTEEGKAITGYTAAVEIITVQNVAEVERRWDAWKKTGHE